MAFSIHSILRFAIISFVLLKKKIGYWSLFIGLKKFITQQENRIYKTCQTNCKIDRKSMTMMVHSPSVFGFRNTDDIFADKRGVLINVNAKSQLCNVTGRMTKWNTKALRNIHLNSNIRQNTEFEDTTWLKYVEKWRFFSAWL